MAGRRSGELSPGPPRTAPELPTSPATLVAHSHAAACPPADALPGSTPRPASASAPTRASAGRAAPPARGSPRPAPAACARRARLDLVDHLVTRSAIESNHYLVQLGPAASFARIFRGP